MNVYDVEEERKTLHQGLVSVNTCGNTHMGSGVEEEEEDEGSECEESGDRLKKAGGIWGRQQENTIFKTFFCRSNGPSFLVF